MFVTIISQLDRAKLTGRGGGCFPTGMKWKMVKKAKGDKKYVICNGSEGEPGVSKDGYVLENFPEDVIQGMVLAMHYLESYNRKEVIVKGIIYLNHDFYKKYSVKLVELIGGHDIRIFCKSIDAGYIGGEETSLLNTLEKKKTEPRLRPPYPTTEGYKNYPTLINNVETFSDASLIYRGKYKNNRYYTINGDVLWNGVYHLPENYTIEQVLKETNNYPNFDFFCQVGGDASGVVLNSGQLKVKAGGAASVTVYSASKHSYKELMKYWAKFFTLESCGQCVPCREGTYRLKQIISSKDPNWQLFAEILNSLKETAFCGLGCVVPVPFETYIKNVINKDLQKINLPETTKKMICECFQ